MSNDPTTSAAPRSGVRCPNPEPHEPHQYTIRSGGVTVAGGLCDPAQWPTKTGGAAPGSATLVDLFAEAKQIRDSIYYAAAPNSPVEKQANRLGQVLFLIEKQVTRPYGE